ncbi:hypothetical protein ACS0TY_017554 [Phlomoides rotata]
MKKMIPALCIISFTIITCLPSVASQMPYDHYPSANLFSLWINNVTLDNTSAANIILRRSSTFGPDYACGFFSTEDGNDSHLFAIFILPTKYSRSRESSRIVWSANRNITVAINATLMLTHGGDLVLRHADGALAWSTGTSGKGGSGLNLTETGNLVLFGANNSVIWQSFDHPTDCLVPEQTLVSGMNLTSSADGDSYSLSMEDRGLVASIKSDSPQLQVYYQIVSSDVKRDKEASYAKFQNGSLELYINRNGKNYTPETKVPIPQAISAQYMKLETDGYLKVYEWVEYGWREVADMFTAEIGKCGYPTVCGNYGICTNGQCRCPNGTSYIQVNNIHPDLGFSEVTPLTCNASTNNSFLELDNVGYFSVTPDYIEIDLNSCKKVCLERCPCKAVIFRYSGNQYHGECFLPSQMFSLKEYDRDRDNRYNYSVSIKVLNAQNVAVISPAVERSPTAAEGNSALLWLEPLLGSSFGVLFVAAVIGTTVFVYRRRRQKPEEIEEDYLDHVPGMPTRFSVQELANATDNFNTKLGEGGFGSVFEGSFSDGTRIAVKRLEEVGHVKKSFLAEVETIGSIHHINLVRLIGFCAEKSHRLLVYEYVCNGSLDRWIYCRNHESKLSWKNRRKIILDIAKGLAYLHEDCRQKIIHLDIKPQNILLDEHYNAKLADFGLSKLIDRDQSQVVTTMRGTPGYLAPEWLSAVITEKVDVYSFGVVILEIVSGRKIFEQLRPEEERHLLNFFMRKAEEGQWLDLVDKCCVDVESNVAEIEEMMRISAWCIQNDYQKRPTMSTVIKVLEGAMDVQKDIDYNFLIPQYLISRIPESSSHNVTHLLPSLVSGPR